MHTITAALERLEDAVEHRPGFGVKSTRSVSTMTDGLHCSTEEGSSRIETDLPPALGGSGAGPTPTMLLRAALGSCMAMTYRLRAARHGVSLTSIRVTVETDSEIAGMLLVDSPAPAGFTELRCHVEVESPDPPDAVARVLDEGDRLSPVLDVLTRTVVMRRTSSIRAGGA